jgi:exonuclease SbcC
VKILRIRLHNLNSLRGEHEINFEKQPLMGAGLFAITGQTGAGKSTLLDAITLGLYGRAARYGNAPSPEDMMSRHTGECRAEVEFEVARGCFRAEWHLRRGRGKADGNVQTPKRYIYDATGQELANSVREADELIERLTGLDYPRFMRSVLLAQGEFARFLKASADDRAQLLESLTGTAIYSELSELAHRETGQREAEVNLLANSLGQVTLLTDAERKEREDSIQQKESELLKIRTELDQLHQQWSQAHQLQSELEAEKGLVAKEQELLARRETAGPELQRLAKHRQTNPFSEHLTRLDVAQKHSRELSNALQTAQTQAHRIHYDWILGVAAGCDFIQDLLARKKQEIATVESAGAEHQKRRQTITDWLVQHSEDKALEHDFPELKSELDRLQALREGILGSKARAQGLNARIEAQKGVIKECETKLAVALATLKTKTEQKAAAEQAFQQLLGNQSEQAREQELTTLRGQAVALDTLIANEKICCAKGEQIQQQQSKLDRLKPALSETQAQLEEARANCRDAQKQVLLRRDHLEKSLLVAKLEDHRAHLTPGEACPLCGATEHPFLQGAAPVVSEDSLRGDLKKAELIHQKALAEVNKKELSLQNLKKDHEHLQQTTARLKAELQQLLQEMETLASQHQVTAKDAGELANAKEAVGNALQKTQAGLTAIQAARTHLAEKQSALLQAEGAANIATQSKTNEERTLSALHEQLREQLTSTEHQERDLQRLSELLSEPLQAYHLALPAPGQEQTLTRTLKERLSVFQGQAQALEKSKADLERSTAELQRHKGVWEDLQRRSNPFLEHMCAHESEAKAADQAACRKLKALWQTIEDAEQALSSLLKAREAAQNALSHRENELKRASLQLEQIANELLHALQGSPFATINAIREARLLNPEADRLESLERKLNTETEQLKGNLDGVRQKMKLLREAKVAEGEALRELDAKVQSVRRTNDEIAETLGRLRSEIARDNQHRQQHAARTAELQEKQKRLVVWKQLHGLIGSHDGRKFRRYAQGISLDILIQNGNKHLRRLTDRYRLRRRVSEELELEIEDLYQAGTTRPMASLSGGESFLASLALALGLADLAGRNVQIDSLFIDEGFGSLDATTLDLAISALEALRQDHKTIGVISHVELLKERIATQIIVERKPGGTSTLRLVP